MVEYPINTDSEGNAFTLNTRYSAMGSGNVMGGAHFPMTAVVEHDELTPPLNSYIKPKKMKLNNEPQCMSLRRTEKAKELRRQGVQTFAFRNFEPREDGITNTLTGNINDNPIYEPKSCAVRGRKDNNDKYIQTLEMGEDISNALTSVQKDSLVSERVKRTANELKEIAGQSRNCNVGVTINPDNSLRPYNADTKAKDGLSEYVVNHENGVSGTNIAARPNNVYGESTLYRIRKLTPRECFRLMDMDEEDIDKIQATGISNAQQYKMAGNSIVVSCLYHIFRTLFIPDQPENKPKNLFDF